MKPRNRDSERIYGLSAAFAVFARRPEAVLSIAHTADARYALSDMLRNAARLRIAYREVDAETLTRMADSVHHEGVCLLVKPKPDATPEEIAQGLGKSGLVLALDGVQNPHNVGAILRSAAYFGAHALLLAGGPIDDKQPTLSAAARRVSEGGAEHVNVARVDNLIAVLKSLAADGCSIIGSDARAEQRVDGFRWPARSVLVLGHEQHGLSPMTRAACQTFVRIAGTPALDSLNVSVAAGIFLASYRSAHELKA